MSSAPVSNMSSLKGKSQEISILSLDVNRPVERLVPGESHQLAAGVSISFLPSTNEGLLEVDSAVAGVVLLDGKTTSEIATVHPGQIIKLKEGRVVIVRHLQSIVIPKEGAAKRPDNVQKEIDAALASITRESVKSANSAAMTNQAPTNTESSKKNNIVRGAIAVAAGLIAIFAYVDSREGSSAKHPQALAETQSATPVTAHIEEKPLPQTPAVVEPKKPEVVSVTKEVSKESPSKPKKVVKTAKIEKPTGEKDLKGPALSEKDRQAVLEYKLEARFDRSTARVKLKQFAETFPANSPARAEVMRAYNEL